MNTREYEWSDVTVVMGGRNITGLRAVKYNTKQEKEALHAKGNKPHSIQRGNVEYSGEITLLQSEYLALRDAARAKGAKSILDISMDLVVVVGNPSKGAPAVTTILKGAEFTEDNTEWKQGDKFQEKTLPFLFLDEKND